MPASIRCIRCYVFRRGAKNEHLLPSLIVPDRGIAPVRAFDATHVGNTASDVAAPRGHPGRPCISGGVGEFDPLISPLLHSPAA